MFLSMLDNDQQRAFAVLANRMVAAEGAGSPNRLSSSASSALPASSQRENLCARVALPMPLGPVSSQA